ncbi:MAG TPA: methyltransferase [Xanthobacteraceae bacterium]|nr:methyltransferase [Xanthobacteraceae bacterium]
MNGKSDKSSEASPALLHKKMLQLLSSLWVTRALGTFARLGLADVMEDGLEDHAAIAAARGLAPDRVYRLLRALSTLGVVTEPARGRFRLTPLGRLLSSHSPNNTRTTAIFLNDYFADMWSHLDDALAGERTAFEVLKGAPFFEWLAQHPDEARRFDRMMLEVHGPETPAIVAAYDFSPFEHVVDIGGGNGSLLSAVLASYPKLRGTLFDLPEAIAAAKRGEGGPLPGVSFASGDIFTTPAPEGGDLYLVRHLLHDYEDRDCVGILANVRRAMRPQARVLVLEAPLPSDDSPGPGRWLDLQVMLLCGGRERTVEEYAGLFEQAGLRLARTIPTRHPAMTIIEAVAAGTSRA